MEIEHIYLLIYLLQEKAKKIFSHIKKKWGEKQGEMVCTCFVPPRDVVTPLDVVTHLCFVTCAVFISERKN